MIRTLRLHDPALFGLALLATVLGLLFVFDAGYARSIQASNTPLSPEFKNQVFYLLPALLASGIAARIKPDSWHRWSRSIWVLSLLSLVAVEFYGREMNGAKRWIPLGPFNIQPAEFAKLATVVYLAGALAERTPWPTKFRGIRDRIDWIEKIGWPKLKRCLPAIWVLVAVGLVESEPDLGTGAVIAATAYALFFAGGVTRKTLVVGLVLSALGAGAMVMKEPYRMERFEHHAHRWRLENVDDAGYQTVQSELAMASGGLWGVGIGAGRAKHVLPATTTDFVLATVGEETGLIGVLIVLGVLGALVARLFVLARKTANEFSALVLTGVGAWIGIQTCTNVMMANGFLPAIGIPLPFVSSGGSSLVALWAAMGACQAVLAPRPVEKEEGVAADRDGWRNRRARLSRA